MDKTAAIAAEGRRLIKIKESQKTLKFLTRKIKMTVTSTMTVTVTVTVTVRVTLTVTVRVTLTVTH